MKPSDATMNEGMEGADDAPEPGEYDASASELGDMLGVKEADKANFALTLKACILAVLDEEG